MPEIEPGVLRTYSGKTINVFNPNPDAICIDDIAHALSNLCRFTGHTLRFYSVAEHSVRASELVDPEHQLAALLHDASEAYLVDIPTPVKIMMPQYREWEYKLMRVIAEKFGFRYPLHRQVEKADKALLKAEWMEQITCEIDYYPYSNTEARAEFMNTYNKIINT